MAVRTTADAVALIIEVDDDHLGTGTDDLASFIEVANNIVTKNCVDEDLTAADLELIESWLSAHFYAIMRARPTREQASQGIGETFQSKVDLGFDVTHYGQMAMRVDWSGALSALNEQAKRGGKITISASWLGSTDTEAATY